jgi:outer membrane protein OmpA-like peptidoglycan-associated protein
VTEGGRLSIGPEAFASLPVAGSGVAYVNAEALLGARYQLTEALSLGVGAGPGIAQGLGTPTFRGLANLAFAPSRAARVAPTAGAIDTDRDGVLDPGDLCVTVPSGEHPDPARRGCPARDTDGDGVFDHDDVCVDVPRGEHADAQRLGCPSPDADHDGVFDADDRCPTDPQGDHADPTRRGCPDGDRDGDQVRDSADQCVDVAAGARPDPARVGCPVLDRDGDSVADGDDRCPDQPGAPSSDPARNGCPGLVIVRAGVIQIMQPVFFATGRDVILAQSFSVLGAVTDTLRAAPEIRRISVEGHTDDVNDDAGNLALSERRAASVVRYLVEHGIDAARLEAHGFGESRPVRSIVGLRRRARAEARSVNRRVEFRIVDPAPTASNP